MKLTKRTYLEFTHKTDDAEYIVEIRAKKGVYEAWLYTEDCGIKMFLFGVPEEQNGERMTMHEFADMVEGNLCYEYSGAIDMYNDEYNF